MMNWRNLLWWRPKARRIAVRFVTYTEGDSLVREGWTIAPEEDGNHFIGKVWLELLENT